MSKNTIDNITGALMLVALIAGGWFGVAMQSWLVAGVAMLVLAALALLLGGVVMYTLGPGLEHSRRFGHTTRD